LHIKGWKGLRHLREPREGDYDRSALLRELLTATGCSVTEAVRLLQGFQLNRRNEIERSFAVATET
jgi:hypothetical protein